MLNRVGKIAFRMYQVNYSEQSLQELEKLPMQKQLALTKPLTKLTESQLAHPEDPLDRFSRNGKDVFRLRAGEYRIYFERDGISLFTICILHKNTLTDFVFRTKLPISEGQLLEQHSSFWKYLDTFKH